MRIVFIGTVKFSLNTLSKVLQLKANVTGIVTQKQSAFNSDFADLSELAIAGNIPLLYTDNINSIESVNWIQDKKPDIIFCFGWSKLLKTEILNLSPMGVVGYHPALLPFNRGRHPIIWALVLGLSETGSTFFFMDEGADSGDILSQKKISIDENDTAEVLYQKVTDTAILQIEEFLPTLQFGNYKREPQNHFKSNYWRKRGRSDGRIDWRMSSKAIYNLVRGLTFPYVGAHVEKNGEDIKVWNVEISSGYNDNIEPGKVLFVENSIVHVKTGDGVIKIIKHEFVNLPNINEYI